MSCEISSVSFFEKCRICLNVEHEMNPLFEAIYEAQEDNESIFLSLSDVLKSISNVELEESEFDLKSVCGNCTMTILNFNNLMKVFQDTQEELRKLFSDGNKFEIQESNLITNNSVENIIIETYDVGPDGESSIDSYNSQPNQFDNNLSKSTNSTCTEDSINFKEGGPSCDEEVKEAVSDSQEEKNEAETEVISKKYSCDECGDVFLIKSGFVHHMLQKHNISVPTENVDKYSSDIKITLPKECAYDAFKFIQKNQFHPKKKFRFQCQICQVGFEKNVDLKLHYNIHRTFKCDQCSAAFIKKSYLKDHMLMHSVEKKYVCDSCGKAFRYRNGLAAHKTIHVNYKPNICEVCGQGFNARTTLLTHMSLKHGVNQKKYTCSECGLVFKVKSWLDKHFLRKHTKNRTKDFVCSVCGISYLNKYTLTRHMNEKHLGKGKRYMCFVCDKSYTMNNKLIGHMQVKHNLVMNK